MIQPLTSRHVTKLWQSCETNCVVDLLVTKARCGHNIYLLTLFLRDVTNNEFLIFFYILFFVSIFIGTSIILIFAEQAMNFIGILLINQ